MEDEGRPEIPDQEAELELSYGRQTADNPDITDIVYLSFRRSRLDYKPESSFLFTNSSFEYIYDIDRKDLKPIRHYFTVDKWPFENKQMAFSFAARFVW